MKIGLAVVAFAVMAAPAMAQDVALETSSTITGSGAMLNTLPENRTNLPQTRTNANGERLICRQIDSTAGRTGSRRVCLTAAEWRAHSGN